MASETKTVEIGVAVTAALIEVPDALERPQRLVQFYDADGEGVPSWCVPLPLYLEAYEGINPYAERAHRLVVARAIIHHLPVPAAVADSHDAKALAEVIVTEGRLHGAMPNKFCRLCCPADERVSGAELVEATEGGE